MAKEILQRELRNLTKKRSATQEIIEEKQVALKGCDAGDVTYIQKCFDLASASENAVHSSYAMLNFIDNNNLHASSTAVEDTLSKEIVLLLTDAFECYKTAATAGHIEAQLRLGVFLIKYYKELQIKLRDATREALQWFLKACDNTGENSGLRINLLNKIAIIYSEHASHFGFDNCKKISLWFLDSLKHFDDPAIVKKAEKKKLFMENFTVYIHSKPYEILENAINEITKNPPKNFAILRNIANIRLNIVEEQINDFVKNKEQKIAKKFGQKKCDSFTENYYEEKVAVKSYLNKK